MSQHREMPSPRRLPRLCAITDRVLANGRSHAEIAIELARGGASWIQIREKEASPGKFLEEARDAIEAVRCLGGNAPTASPARSPDSRSIADPGSALHPSSEEPASSSSFCLVLVNDRVDIAMAAGADGVHVGRDDLPAAEARRLLGGQAIVGVSTHSLEEGVAAAELPVDYVAIGPVFPTWTKPGAEPVVGLECVRRLASAVRLPLVGIGGIDAENARSVLDAGAHAVAVISALYGSGRSIAQSLSTLLRAIE